MKILHVTSSLDIGGIERLLVNLCQVNDYSLSNITIVIINNHFDNKLLQDIKNTPARIICLNRYRGKRYNIALYIYKLRKILREIQPDIIHYHTHFSLTFGVLASAFLKIKRVYTLHNLKLYSHRGLSLLVAIKTTDLLIAISEAVKESFLKNINYKQLVKITVIPNGIDLDHFKARRKLVMDRLRIICIARLNHEDKGQDILLKALSILKDKRYDYRCVFIGEGESEVYLKHLSKNLGLTSCVCFCGKKNNIADLLAASNLFVLPSRFEGFGISIIEAMAAGVPVIASDVGGIKEIIQDQHNGLLFKSEDSADLANQIELISNDKALMQRIRTNALSMIHKYSIRNMNNAYYNAYRLLLCQD